MYHIADGNIRTRRNEWIKQIHEGGKSLFWNFSGPLPFRRALGCISMNICGYSLWESTRVWFLLLSSDIQPALDLFTSLVESTSGLPNDHTELDALIAYVFLLLGWYWNTPASLCHATRVNTCSSSCFLEGEQPSRITLISKPNLCHQTETSSLNVARQGGKAWSQEPDAN